MTEGFQDFQSNSPGQEMSGPTCLLCNDAIERRIGLAGLGICLLCELDLRRGHLRGVVWTSGSGQRWRATGNSDEGGARTLPPPGPVNPDQPDLFHDTPMSWKPPLTDEEILALANGEGIKRSPVPVVMDFGTKTSSIGFYGGSIEPPEKMPHVTEAWPEYRITTNVHAAKVIKVERTAWDTILAHVDNQCSPIEMHEPTPDVGEWLVRFEIGWMPPVPSFVFERHFFRSRPDRRSPSE